MLKKCLLIALMLSSTTFLLGTVTADSPELLSYKKKASALNDTLLKNGELSKSSHDEVKQHLDRMTDADYKKNQKVLISAYDTLNKMDPKKRKGFIEMTQLLIKNGITPQLPASN